MRDTIYSLTTGATYTLLAETMLLPRSCHMLMMKTMDQTAGRCLCVGKFIELDLFP